MPYWGAKLNYKKRNNHSYIFLMNTLCVLSEWSRCFEYNPWFWKTFNAFKWSYSWFHYNQFISFIYICDQFADVVYRIIERKKDDVFFILISAILLLFPGHYNHMSCIALQVAAWNWYSCTDLVIRNICGIYSHFGWFVCR